MSEHRYALFLGCTVSVRALNYELSTRKIAERLGIEFVDLPGFACCGYPIASIHHNTSVTLAARNLAFAEAEGVDIITLCSACTGHLTKVSKLLSDDGDADELERVNSKLKDLGYQYNGSVKVKHFTRLLYEDIGIDKLRESVTEPLTGLNIAPHYGCHYVKPSNLFDGFDDPIRPQSLDKLIAATGATPTYYKDKMQCCGGGILAIDENTSINMVKEKLDHIKEAQADAMMVICPFCDIMYDEYQPDIGSNNEIEYNIPVLYYPQLLGLAMGLDPKKDLAVKKNQVSVKPLLKKLEMLRSGSESHE